MVNIAKIAVGVLLAIALALGVYGWMLAKAPPAPQVKVAAGDGKAASTINVVVAAQPLLAGQPIKAEDLQLAGLSSRPDGAYDDVPAAAGSVPAVDIPKGAPILKGQLVTGLALKVPEGERAVAVKVDESVGAGNRIRPGDFVDVFFVLRRDGNEIDQSQARLLLSRKRVLAYGAASVDSLTSGQEKADGKPQGGSPESARTAVLSVPVEEVSRLALGGSNGSLLLALRNPADTSEPDMEKFSPLPGVLAVSLPKGTAANIPLEGADAAQAGVAMSTLAGVAGLNRSNLGARPGAPVNVGPAKPAVPRVRTASSDSSLAVEFVRGANTQTVRY
ncbi:MAG: Flp pilus assembly protein CpaB [Comamonas sp.]|jgi:pilus assembly protein CpaB|uniref:Flp pilus assembly protein CpaB n=1 Tax=Comamonas sp. TaxID=34028 RepID=UPI0028232004|nr:Flp pilus assembly protein CpaB [Comamonas sp.]MDR0216231.1 Flp pilus assembly protein CpaB [Comamonas sp.]